MQKKSFRFDIKICVGKTLNVDICSKFWGNFKEILGNPGVIPHIGWKTHRQSQEHYDILNVWPIWNKLT